MLFEPKFTSVEKDWLTTIICPATSIILSVNAIALFKDFVQALFDPAIFEAIGVSRSPPIHIVFDLVFERQSLKQVEPDN